MDNGILTSLVSFDQSNIPKPSCVDGWKPVRHSPTTGNTPVRLHLSDRKTSPAIAQLRSLGALLGCLLGIFRLRSCGMLATAIHVGRQFVDWSVQ